MPTGDFPDPEGMVWTDAAGWVPASSPVWQREVSDAVARLAALPPPTPDPRDAEIERLRAALKEIAETPDVAADESCMVARRALEQKVNENG